MNIQRLAILIRSPAADKAHWSGIPHRVHRALESRFPEVRDFVPPPLVAEAFRWTLRRWTLKAFGKARPVGFRIGELRRRAKVVSAELNAWQPDLILAITVDDLVAFLDVDAPVVLLGDATYRLMRDYYPFFRDVPARARRRADSLCHQAVQKSRLMIYPSKWAADSAIEHYGASPEDVHRVPLGVNLEDPPSREEALRELPRDRCRLLFLGGDFERKGGPTAVRAVEVLAERGVPAELVIVGEIEIGHPLVRCTGFLRMSEPAEVEQLRGEMQAAHMLLLPTTAEAFGIVFGEAGAWGMPSITTRTGGVPDNVIDGETGVLLPVGAGAEEYADVVERLWRDEPAYEAMRRAARDRYERVLNWEAWGDRVAEIFAALLSGGAR